LKQVVNWAAKKISTIKLAKPEMHLFISWMTSSSFLMVPAPIP
jgi:hypothetical protein